MSLESLLHPLQRLALQLRRFRAKRAHFRRKVRRELYERLNNQKERG